MLKKILLILSLATVSLFGTQDSRVNSLTGFESGYGADYQSPLNRSGIYDPSDVMIFPHLANKYADFANFYYAGANSYNAFGTFNIMDGLTIGVSDRNKTRPIWGLQGSTDVSSVNHQYSIFGGYNIGKIDIGLSLDYWASSYQDELVVLNTATSINDTYRNIANANIFTLKASLGMDLGNSMGFDSLFNIDFGSYNYETYDSTGTPTTRLVNSSDGYLALSVGGRFFMNLSYAVKMTAWAFLDYSNEGYSDLQYNTENKKVDTVKYTQSSLLINLGTAFNIEAIKEKLIVTPALGVMLFSADSTTENLTAPTTKSKVQDTMGVNALPYIGLSVEYNIKKWLTFYTGYTKLVLSNSQENYILNYNNDTKQSETTQTVEGDDVNSNFALGLSLQNDVFKFTASMNKGLLVNGPNFISGETTTPMFLNATLQYKFGAPEEKITTKK